MKTVRKLFSGLSVVLMCLSLLCATSVCVMAEGEEGDKTAETSKYASTDYANRKEDFEQLLSTATGAEVTFPAPEAYVEGITTRMKYIVDGALIKEKYSDKTFIMPFCGAELKVAGSYLAEIGGSRIELQIEQVNPIAVQYSCPKCATTPKDDSGKFYTPMVGTLGDKFTLADESTGTYVCPRCKSSFTLNECAEPEHQETVKGAIQIIETEKHPVVGDYVLKLDIYSDNRAVSNFGTEESGITCTIKAASTKAAMDVAKSEEGFDSFNVYAYMSQTSDYNNMEAVIDEANGTATFLIRDRGWFYIAADKKGNAVLTAGQILKQWLPVIIIAAVVVIGGVVALIVVLGKKKKAPAAE